MRLERIIYIVATLFLGLFLFTTNVYAANFNVGEIVAGGSLEVKGVTVQGDTVTLAPDENGDIKISQIQEVTFTMTPDPNLQMSEVLLDARYLDYITQEKLDDPSTVLPEPPYSVYNDCTSSDGVVFSYHWVKLAEGDIGNHTFDVAFAPIPVVASFNASTASGEITTIDEVQFTDTSQGPLSSWTWDFGDGSPVSMEQNPIHTFADAGTFTVTLTVGNALTSDIFSADYTVESSYLSSPVMQKSTLYGYFSLQDAYDNIAGLVETIKMKSGELPLEDIFIDKIDVSVLIEGGYDDTFENVVDYTIINGNVTVTFGNVTMSNVIISSLN